MTNRFYLEKWEFTKICKKVNIMVSMSTKQPMISIVNIINFNSLYNV